MKCTSLIERREISLNKDEELIENIKIRERVLFNLIWKVSQIESNLLHTYTLDERGEFFNGKVWQTTL